MLQNGDADSDLSRQELKAVFLIWVGCSPRRTSDHDRRHFCYHKEEMEMLLASSGRGQDAAQHPTVHRRSDSTTKNDLARNGNSAVVENSRLRKCGT